MTGSNIKISIKNGSVNQIMKSHIFTTNFSSIYPLYVQKAEKKNRTKKEVDEIICWLTGYDLNTLEKQLNNHVDFATFFNQAPQINPNSSEIKGKVCGVQVGEIEDPLMQKIRYLDKLIDELAKGNPMEKILRTKKTSNKKVYEYDAIIQCAPKNGGAYLIFPWNVKTEFGKGRVKVHASFDGEPYDGSIVNMGLKHEDGSICYIIGITKTIRHKIKKNIHDSVHVIIQERT